MKQEKVRLLVLGTGAMAATHMRQFVSDPRVEIVAVADTNLQRAESFAQRFSVEAAFGSVENAIAGADFDAAANVTPDAAHFDTTMALISAGKHVFCEKPLADTFPRAKAMADAAESAALTNMVNLSYRNVAAVNTARRLVQQGEIGDVRHIEASYRQSWLVGNFWGDWRNDPKWLWRLSSAHGSKGVLGDVGIHIVDFACFASGLMPVNLQARLKTFPKLEDERIGEYVLDANDSAVLSIEFDNGAIGIIHASRWMTGYDNVLKLGMFGTKGAIEISHGLDSTLIRACLGGNVHDLAWRRVIAGPVESTYSRFVSAVLAGRNDEPSFRHAAQLQAIIDQCFEPVTGQASGTVSQPPAHHGRST